MCGIATIVGPSAEREKVQAMIDVQSHRGPDAEGVWLSETRQCVLGHRRLSVIDLSEGGRQPMRHPSGRYHITYNGEIYNYLELRKELAASHEFRTGSDTEVVLAAYAKWGAKCLDRFIGMFAMAVWDEQERSLFAARDRFGVKPLYFHEPKSGGVWLASEIKALHAAGAGREPDASTWAGYLSRGTYNHSAATFWEGIRQVEPGHALTWSADQGVRHDRWYDVAEAALKQGVEERSDNEVGEELTSLLKDSVGLRFRSDVPVGVCLSGGLDSSLLLGLVNASQGAGSQLKTFTFICNDPEYDETPWVKQMLEGSEHQSCFCPLSAEETPGLAARVTRFQDEPFGGLPTLGMAKVHARAKQEGVTVLLDGNGMDEGWAGYEYYQRATKVDAASGPVQGSRSRSTRPDCLNPDFAAQAAQFIPPKPFGDALKDLQYRDIRHSKIPRGMRFADRVSMMESRELREPFLDHRLIELGLRQPASRKIRDEQGKWLPRRIADQLLPSGVREAPKRPVQTPQREWLRGPLQGWANDCVETAISAYGDSWLSSVDIRKAFAEYTAGESDNSFYIWQWLSLGLMVDQQVAA